MGSPSGNPTRISPDTQARLQALNDAMMRQQQAYTMPPWMNQVLHHRPPDLYIAGQVFDGVTGELKRKT